MRIGIVLTVTFNLPLSRIERAGLHPTPDGSGDIALTLERGTRIAWLHLWPHARPWQRGAPAADAALRARRAGGRGAAGRGVERRPTACRRSRSGTCDDAARADGGLRPSLIAQRAEPWPAPSTAPTPHRDIIPARALWLGAACCSALVLAAAGAARWSGFDAPRSPTRTPSPSARCSFDDRADGGIAIVDAASGATLERVHGEQGFLRGTLRGLARERKRARPRPRSTVRSCIGRADGRLTLIDPATGERIDLESFGPDQRRRVRALAAQDRAPSAQEQCT